jgi:hypothetical protein
MLSTKPSISQGDLVRVRRTKKHTIVRPSTNWDDSYLYGIVTDTDASVSTLTGEDDDGVEVRIVNHNKTTTVRRHRVHPTDKLT